MNTPAPSRLGRPLVASAFAVFLIANLIHNRFGLDPAIIPAALFVTLLLWRPRRAFLIPAALLIAVPSFLFLKWTMLIDPGNAITFVNHLALFTAGTLAAAALLVDLLPARAVQPGVED